MELINSKLLKSINKISTITATNPNSNISEQYRSIRTNLLSIIKGTNSKTIIITSPNRKEGKSTTAVNLAITLAQQGKKVLLIDADFRNSILHNIFNKDNSIGLSNVLEGSFALEETIKHTEVKGLDLLSSGSAYFNSTELLDSKEMELVIQSVTKLYDLVIFDTSPTLEVSDVKILADQCDSLFLVIRWGKTHSDDALNAKKNLESANAKILGVILNEKK